jgi:hypothetical protein
MPRKPIEWSKCIIYKIWKDDEFYVGSTTDFTNRKRSHKCSCTDITHKSYNYKIYQTIREKGGWDSWQMIPLEEYTECQSQIQARIREEEWRVKLNAQLNMRRAFIDEEGIKLRTKQYREEHKEEIKTRTSQWYKINKKERQEYSKKYVQDHKEERHEYSKKFHQENKDKIHTYKNQKFGCECGGKYTQSNKEQHKRSIKHQTYLATI